MSLKFQTCFKYQCLHVWCQYTQNKTTRTTQNKRTKGSAAVLSLSHVTCSSYHTYFQTFLSNMRLSPFHQPRHVFRFDPFLSLSLLLRLGIQLHFTASMPVSLFTASQICYYQCEAKMKRPQIGVRRRISELLCVKSTSFSFLFFLFFFPFLVRYHIFWYG